MKSSFTRIYLLYSVIAAFSIGGYLLVSGFTFRLGFPLDDAWIHQTYARNLALLGEWSFIPGQPSAGSTAPAWSFLLAFGYAIRSGPYLWTYLLGWLLLTMLGICGFLGFGALCPGRTGWQVLAGIFLILEWHLVWAAGSGMETLLFAVMALLMAAWAARLEGTDISKDARVLGIKPGRWAGIWGDDWIRWLGVGALAGVSLWVRPDGLSLLGLIAIAVLSVKGTIREKLRIATQIGLGFGIILLPYLIFNQTLSGDWWPNTFYAKQAEYIMLRRVPFWMRFINEGKMPLIGAGVLLFPGFIWTVVYYAIRRDFGKLAGGAWLIAYLCLYAWRLPVIYQHGRYIIPAMPIYFLLGLTGVTNLIDMVQKSSYGRVIGRAWIVAIGLLLLAFWGLGARAYGQDVAVIESEMVAMAQWLNENTEPGALIAAHDIGAIGFFSERKLLDLAGLISPEVIPFIRDENQLASYLDQQKAEYLVTFPSWYPNLVQRAERVVSTQGNYSPALGGENMVVFRWRNR